MKVINLIWILFPLVSLAQLNQTSIHQQQLELYNASGHSLASDYESVPNEAQLSFNKNSSCLLNKVVYGWHPYWLGSAYTNYQWDLLSHFSFFSYEVDETDGSAITTHGWTTSAAVDAALATDVKVTLCVTLFGSSVLTTFLDNATAKQNLIDNLITLIQDRGADGVNIDFEGLPASQKTNFANFMVDLSDQMHTAIPDSEVSTVLYAVDWSDVFDFSIMSSAVDHFIVMGYGYYYSGSATAGPTDPLYQFGTSYNYTLSKTITYYLEAGCPSNKLVMGLPYYGYEWTTSDLNVPSSTTGTGTARTYSYIKNNSSGYYTTVNHQYDTDSYTDIYAFNDGTDDNQAFITLEDGFKKRLWHINNTGIAGIGIWALGYDNGYTDLWDGINDYLTDCYVDSCLGIIHDFGGPTKDYYNNEDYTWTIQPPSSTSIDVDFSSFDVELNYDTLFIYDGSTTSSVLIGAYTGTNSPGSFSTSTGAVTFRFKSDGATTAAGFYATYQCQLADTVPQAIIDIPTSFTVCEGEGISMGNASINSNSYLWDFGNGTSAYLFEPMAYYSQSGTYTVTLTAYNGTYYDQTTQTISVTVVPQAIPDFTTTSPAFWPNSVVYFTNQSTNYTDLSWDFGDGNVSTDTHPWHLYDSIGQFNVTLTLSSTLCPDTSFTQTVEIINDLGIENINSWPLIYYPNPFNDYINVEGIKAGDVIQLYDLNQRLVFEQVISSNQSAIQLSGFSHLSSGTYLIRLIKDDEIKTGLIIKN